MIKLTIISLLTFMAVSVHAAMLAGSEPKDWPANPERHTISITREASTDVERKMIQAAEKARPDSGAWWVEKDGKPVLTLGLKTPYAITKDALDYYSARIKEYQQKKWSGRAEPRSKLVYEASVSLKDKYKLDGREYSDVYVVTMSLTLVLAHVEEPAAGTTIQKTRTVVLDGKGVPLAISGDGDESFPVWMM